MVQVVRRSPQLALEVSDLCTHVEVPQQQIENGQGVLVGPGTFHESNMWFFVQQRVWVGSGVLGGQKSRRGEKGVIKVLEALREIYCGFI